MVGVYFSLNRTNLQSLSQFPNKYLFFVCIIRYFQILYTQRFVVKLDDT